MDAPRLRQAVVVARDLDATAAALQEAFGLAAPFHDEGVGLFGLRNAVFAVGDGFLEVVAPTDPAVPTAAGRQLERLGGDGGYMALVQVDGLAAARGRAAALGVRDVWSIDLDDIAATHLHPADVGGAILSLDEPRPPASWRWGGPSWRPGPHGLRGITVEVPDPAAARERWEHLAGGPLPAVRFAPGGRGIVAIDLGAGGPVVDVGACRVR